MLVDVGTYGAQIIDECTLTEKVTGGTWAAWAYGTSALLSMISGVEVSVVLGTSALDLGLVVALLTSET